MKLLAFSDLHCSKPQAHALVDAAMGADLVIGAGDFASQHRGLERIMDELLPFEHKAVYAPGNNETPEALRAATKATVLHGESLTQDGITIVGIGGAVPPLPALPWGSYDLTEDEAAAMLAPFTEADVLITHSPPYGVADELDNGTRVGSHAVRAWIETVQPRLVLCGHIHGCWGMSGPIGATMVHNLGPSCNWFDL